MNKLKFKEQIDNFLLEIETRKQEVLNGNLISITHVGKNLLNFARINFKDEYPLVYSVKGIRLDTIFHLGSKSQLHNASNWIDIERLTYALKYEIIANKNQYKDCTLDEFYYVYWGYLVRLMRNFNWTTTLNVNNVPYYLNWLSTKNIFSNEAIKLLYNLVIVQNENTVKDINGEKKMINIKNSDYNMAKKLTKEELIGIIESFDSKPTVNDITNQYNSSLNKDDDEYSLKYISKELMRHYINDYELNDMIKCRNHSKAFIQKQSEKFSK